MNSFSGDPNVRVLNHPLVEHKMVQLRDKSTPGPLFRRLLKEISLFLAIEAFRGLPMVQVEVETPLATTVGSVLESDPVVVSVLRAGNGLLDGFLEVAPSARVGFLGMYRDHDTLEAVEYYQNLPADIADRSTVVVDPMLATANTAVAALANLREAGATSLSLACLVASPEGVAAVRSAHPDVVIYSAAVDEALNNKGYILPGLGDAGDRIYGTT